MSRSEEAVLPTTPLAKEIQHQVGMQEYPTLDVLKTRQGDYDVVLTYL